MVPEENSTRTGEDQKQNNETQHRQQNSNAFNRPNQIVTRWLFGRSSTDQR